MLKDEDLIGMTQRLRTIARLEEIAYQLNEICDDYNNCEKCPFDTNDLVCAAMLRNTVLNIMREIDE